MRISDWSSDVCSSDLGGFDFMRHDVYNLYGRDLHGSYVFESLEDFANGDYDVYNLRTPARGYDVDDTAAALVYTQVSPFLQDTWQVNDNLSLNYGVRINMPKANKAPEEIGRASCRERVFKNV